jgi:hypothetical protein
MLHIASKQVNGDLLNIPSRRARGRKAVRPDIPDRDLAADHLMVLDKARSHKEPVTLLAPLGASKADAFAPARPLDAFAYTLVHDVLERRRGPRMQSSRRWSACDEA